MLDITIDNKKYEYVNSVRIDDKSYIAYSDGTNTYISEFYYDEDIIKVTDIDEETFIIVKEVMQS